MDTDLLASLIDKKLVVLERLRQLSRRQPELVQGGDMTALLAVLGAKQTLLNELHALERQIDPFREEDPDRRQWRSSADRVRCRQASERCESLLQEVMLIEKQCETSLCQRRDEVANKLKEFHHAAHATSAYVDFAPHVTASQLDLMSET